MNIADSHVSGVLLLFDQHIFTLDEQPTISSSRLCCNGSVSSNITVCQRRCPTSTSASGNSIINMSRASIANLVQYSFGFKFIFAFQSSVNLDPISLDVSTVTSDYSNFYPPQLRRQNVMILNLFALYHS